MSTQCDVCVCNVFVCCVLRGAVWCCVLWCFVRCEICVTCCFVTPLRLLGLSLFYLSTTLVVTMTMTTRPVDSLFVHTTLTCPECQSEWFFTHSMFRRKFQIKKENSKGSSCASLVSHVVKWMFLRWSTGTVCVLHVLGRVCLCVA